MSSTGRIIRPHFANPHGGRALITFRPQDFAPEACIAELVGIYREVTPSRNSVLCLTRRPAFAMQHCEAVRNALPAESELPRYSPDEIVTGPITFSTFMRVRENPEVFKEFGLVIVTEAEAFRIRPLVEVIEGLNGHFTVAITRRHCGGITALSQYFTLNITA